MEEHNFSYVDALQSSSYRRFAAEQLDNSIQLTGRKTYIFLLDKIETNTTVYGEEKTGRIYLPHFEQRALYKSNNISGSLSSVNFSETEENLEMEFSFDRMVRNINDLKNQSAGKLTIQNISKVPLEIIINEKQLIISKMGNVITEKNLEGDIISFINNFNNDLIKLTYTGNTDDVINLEKINITLKPRRIEEINLFSSVYKNTTDVIENGTIILNDRFRAYEVVSAYPKTNLYGDYTSWLVQCGIVNLARIDGLPSDFNEFIKNNQFGLPKINRE